MAQNSFQITRRALIALPGAAAVASVAPAAAKETAVARLARRFARDISRGMTGFHLSPGPRLAALLPEERAQAVLDALEAGDRGRPLAPEELDGDL